MPRRKKIEEYPEEDEYFNGSLEYGMDDYDDPTDQMTPEEIEELAHYIEMIQNGGGEDFDDDSEEDEVPTRGRRVSKAKRPDALYPEDYEEGSDDE